MTEAKKTASPLKLIRDFFDMNLSEMKAEWTNGGLTTEDKAQLTAGLADGTLTY